MTDQGDPMPFQVLFDAAIGALGILGGWILGMIWGEVKQVRADHSKLVAKLPETYARRDDVAEALERIDKGLTRIFDKLDAKADKPHR